MPRNLSELKTFDCEGEGGGRKVRGWMCVCPDYPACDGRVLYRWCALLGTSLEGGKNVPLEDTGSAMRTPNGKLRT